MDKANYEKSLVNEEDSTIVETQLTTDGVEDFVEAKSRIDVPREFLGARDNRFQRCANESVTMRLAAG